LIPLHFAARNGRLEMVRFLIEKGSSPTALSNLGQCYAEFAMENRHDAVADFFLGHHPDRALMERLLGRAAELGNAPVVVKLIEHETDPNCEDPYGVRQ
jgi:isopentenyl diphosphate isomerase/L-lactate dehydrogenase-like FMN-dependent dehydrogenase